MEREGGREGGRERGRVELSYVASPPDLVNPRLLAGGRIVAAAGAAGQRRHVHPAAARGQAGALDQAPHRPSSASTAARPTGDQPSPRARPPRHGAARRPPGEEAAGRWRGGVRRRRAGREPREGGGERWVGRRVSGLGRGGLGSPRVGWRWDVRACRLASGLRPHGRRRLGVRVAVWRGCSSVQLGRWAQMFFRVVDRGPRHLGLGREEIANGVHCAASPTAL